MVCVVSDDPTGASLPSRLGPWVKTEVPWDGQDAAFLIGIREFLERGEDRAWGDEPLPLRN